MRLLETPYCRLDLDESRAFVRMTRTEVPYPTIDTIEEERLRIRGALRRLRGERRVLVDLRAVRPRDEAAFEAAIGQLRREIFGCATRVALLVQTAAGLLQTRRHLREDGAEGEAFQDEAEAIAYLTEPVSGRTRRAGSSAPPPGRVALGRR